MNFGFGAKQSGGVSGGNPPSICDKARNKKNQQMNGFIYAFINSLYVEQVGTPYGRVVGK